MELRDIEAVVELEKLSFSTPWSREAFYSELLENPLACYLVAKYAGKVIGYIGMWIIQDEAHITNLAVHPQYRRQHVGKALLAMLINYAKLHGVTRMTLEVRESNVAAQALYRQFGFTSQGVRKGYYTDNNENAIIMWKDAL